MLAAVINGSHGMEQLNQQLFLLLNSGAGHPGGWRSHLAVFLAEWLVWALPALLLHLWFKGDFKVKKAAVGAGLSAVLALSAGGIIGWLHPHPRPFALGLGHLLVSHAPDASLPSDHLTLWWGIALGLACSPHWRKIGLLLTLAGLVPAWARIYVGVHFPLDMVAAFLVSLGASQAIRLYGRTGVARATLAGMHVQRLLLKRHVPG